MEESAYWHRFWRRRLSRRGVLKAAALGGAGLAAAASFGCDGDQKSPSASAGPPAPAGGLGNEPARYRGGTLNLPGFEAFISDTLDPHQTQFGPIYSSHSAVFSKVLRYIDIPQGVIATDLAESLPEVIDGVEYIIRLRPGVRFQRPSAVLDRPPTAEEQRVGGRELTAEDVKFSFQRQMNPDSPRRALYYRAYQYQTIERIETPDKYTVRVVTKEPIVTFLHYLADTNAFIVPMEVVDAKDDMDRQEAMLGTGPFIWDRLEPLQRSRFVANPDWFGWDDPELGRPYIEAYQSLFIADDATLEVAFRDKKLDAALQVANARWVLNVRQSFPEVIGIDTGFAAWLNVRLLVDRPPFNDFKLRRALHLAADRQQMIDALWQGWGRMQGPISPILKRWALPERELMSEPGYRTDRSQRQQDLQEARQLYEAAGSPKLEMVFADQPDYVRQFAPQFQRHLEDVLGASVETRIRNYLYIAEGHLRGSIAMSFQFDNGWIDLDDWVYPSFHSRGPKNSFRLEDPTLDRMLEAQRREFDFERRQKLGWEIQHYLLDNVLARLDYVTPTILWLAWPHYRNFNPSPFFGNSFWLADAWLDRDQPSFKERG